MLERDDSPEKVKKRILNDREVFKDVIKKLIISLLIKT